jgi:metal-responsive CopG/Arc/MetJ family transcriptional regulator
MPTKISERHAAELERVLSRHEKKQKASVSLSGELIRAADVLAGKAQRSALLERAVRRYFRQLLRRVRHDRDLRRIDARAEVINRESDSLLDLQSWPK